MPAGKGRGRPPEKPRAEAVTTPWQQRLLVATVLSAAVLLAYSNSFHTGFPADSGALLQDPRLRLATGENLNLILRHTYWWPSGEAGLYRPLTTLSYLFNFAILGNQERPAGYHWVNFLLHLGNMLLVYALMRRLAIAFRPAASIAGLWGLHPVLSDAVTPIAGRSDLLAAMAVLGGFLAYLKSTGTGGWRRVAWTAALMAITTAGVFSKENAVAILGVVVAYELTFWKERKQIRGLLLGCLALAPPFLLMWYQRSIVLAGSPPAQFPFLYNPIAAAGFWTGRLTAIKVMARYLGLLVWPAKLSCDYYYAEIPLAHGGMGDWIAWVVVAGAVAALALLFRKNRTCFFLAAFSFATFLPVSNLMLPIGTIMAERFLYLPSVAFAAGIVLAVWRFRGLFQKRPGLAPAALCLIAAAFGVRTWARNPDWHDNLSLWSAAVRACPNSFKAHSSLASALFESDPAHANIDRVIQELETSRGIIDTLPDALSRTEVYTPLGACYRLKGDLLRPPASTEAYRRSLHVLTRGVAIDNAFNRWNTRQESGRGKPISEIGPAGDAELYRQLSLTYFRLNQHQQALDAAAYARVLSYTSAAAYRQIAEIHLARGNATNAAIAMMESLMAAGDQDALPALQAMYRGGLDPAGCAVGRGGALNALCGPVHEHICAASADLAQVNLEARRPDLAGRIKNAAIIQHGCPATLFTTAGFAGGGSR